MPIKEVKYGSYSAAPGDHECLEGDLAVSMNLIPEDNTIKPVLPPSEMATIPGDPNLPNNKGKRIVCIHQTSAFKHFIVAIDYEGLYHTPYTSLYWWGGTEGSQLNRIGGNITFGEIHKVEPIGNTLVILASDGIHYILWKNGSYHYLGTHLPELDLQFELKDGEEYESSEHTVDWDVTGHGGMFPDQMTPLSWFDTDEQYWTGSTGDLGKEVAAKLRQAVMASLNEVIGKACEDKRFTFPMFVRYGFRLYNGDITMHSAPALLVPTLTTPSVDMGWAGISHDRLYVKNPAKVKASFTGYKLHCKPLDMNQVAELAQWSDIVSSIDIFISPQIYTYNQGAKDREIIIGQTTLAPANSHLISDITDNGAFYLAKEIRLSGEMPQHNKLLQQGGDIVKIDFEPTNDNIVTRELMTDDYGTHDELFAEQSFAYNSRINLAGVSKKLFNGFNPACMWRRVTDSIQKVTTATVVIETDGMEIVVQSPSGVVWYAPRSGEKKFLWFYYPNPAAKRVYLDIDGEKLLLELTSHSMLNGAYYCSLDEDAEQTTVTYIPSPSSDQDRIIETPNKVYTSEVNNPFYFPATGINTVGTGEIIGICAAVKALSQGQFGQFPLYAFTSDGVWALQSTAEGGYSAVQPVTRDVCISADSITQLDDAVLFATDRGIMLISGSQTQCISEAIDSDYPFSVASLGIGLDVFQNLTGFTLADLAIAPFKDFSTGMRMLYDYEGQRIIVYNKSYRYAYIYSLESHKWGMMQSDIAYTINSYPDALAVTKDNMLVNYSEPKQVEDGKVAVDAVLLTRPLMLDMPDVLKTVDTVMQRGMFRPRMGYIRSIIFGSRDNYNWRIVASSQDENIRGFRGTPYKWFRVMLLLHIPEDESVTSATIKYEPRMLNRPR